MSTPPPPKKIRIQSLAAAVEEGRKLAMITAYDAITAAWADAAGVDMILVGDSLGNTALGLPDTIAVTLNDMTHHCAAVTRAVKTALTIVDMPFMTGRVSAEKALAAAARLIQEGRAQAVKLEGGAKIAPVVAKMIDAGIPVMGHIGMLPQSYHAQGGYRVHGRAEAEAERLINDAKALEDAGAFAIVLEVITAPVAARITEALRIPTIGIGAGPDCDGQVLVIADALGMTDERPYKHAKHYADLGEAARRGIRSFVDEVRSGKFPTEENSFGG